MYSWSTRLLLWDSGGGSGELPSCEAWLLAVLVEAGVVEAGVVLAEVVEAEVVEAEVVLAEVVPAEVVPAEAEAEGEVVLGASFLLVFFFFLLFCSSFEQSMQMCHPTGLARPQTLGSSLQPGSSLVYCGQGFSHGAEQVSTAGAERTGPCPSPPPATTSPPEQYGGLWRGHQAPLCEAGRPGHGDVQDMASALSCSGQTLPNLSLPTGGHVVWAPSPISLTPHSLPPHCELPSDI